MKVKVLADTKDLSREQWLGIRKQGLGGSDAAAVCGLNPYRSPVAVWADKTAEGPTEIPDTEAMRVGRDLEQYVASRFTEVTGKKVRRKNAIMQSEDHPFMLANVDRVIVGENALLECKTTSPYNADQWADGKCPESYEIQCHHYMAVTGAEKVYLACLILGREFVIVEVARDEEVIRSLQTIESEFWESYVVTKEMPPPDGSDSAKEIISQMYPGGDEEAVELPELADSLKRYDELDAMISQMKSEKDQIKQMIWMGMKDAETAYIGDRKVTWKAPKQSYTVDDKRLKAEMPDVYEAFKKPKRRTRRFTVSKRKEEAHE